MSITSNQIFTDITLDVSGKSSLSNISANQGNIKSHFVKAKLRDDTQAYIPPSTATGLVSFLTPRNTKIYEDVVSISGDTVTFELTESMLGTAGMGLCDISIIDNGSVLMSATVKVSIKPKAVPNDDDIVKDSDEYNVLVNALATAQEGEAVRDNAESLRKSNESTRQTNEINRQQNLTTAIEAIIRADNATDNANSATDRANSATDRADDAADRANTSADRADDATSRANTAIATTEAATQNANSATDNAIDTATNLETTYSPRLTNVETHLAESATELTDMKTELNNVGIQTSDLQNNKMDKNTTDISFGQINKNKVLLDETYMSDEFLQQMTGNTPVQGVPADGGVTNIKIADKAVDPFKLSEDVLLNKYPFHAKANFGTIGLNNLNLNRMNDITSTVKHIELHGADARKTYALAVIARNSTVATNPYEFRIYEAIGNSLVKEVCAFRASASYVEPIGFSELSLTESGKSGVTGKVLLDWGKMPDNTSYDSMAYNNAGLHIDCLIENIPKNSVTSEKLDGKLRIINDTYKNEIEYKNAIISAGQVTRPKPMESTFAGWSIPLKYNGESFVAVEVYLNLEFNNTKVRCSVMNNARETLVYSVDRIENKSGWHLFIFEEEVGSALIKGNYFYVSVEVEDHSSRMMNGIVTGDGAWIKDESVAKDYYTTTSLPLGDWAETTGKFRPLAVRFVERESLSSQVEILKRLDDLESRMIDVNLPDEIFAVVGKEINIYFENLISGDYQDYIYDVTCSIGCQQNERWTVTPTAEGEFPMTIDIYDKSSQDNLGSSNATIKVKKVSAGTDITKKALFIGDSTTAAGVYTEELLNLFADDPMNIELLGTLGTGLNKYEGRGGWKVSQYYSSVDSPFVFDGAFNFSRYMSENAYSNVDYVSFHLGINDVFSQTADEGVKTLSQMMITQLDAMISNIKTFNPLIKIGVMLTIPPSYAQDSFGKSYGSGQTRWRYKRNWFLLVEEYMKHYEGRSYDNIYIVPLNVNLDTENNMQTDDVAINSRNPKTITRQSNGVHPADIGYYQMADTIYYWLKSFEV